MASRAATQAASATGFGPAPTKRGRGRSIFGLFLTLVAIGILVTLGMWQLQRKAWKEHLLARIEMLKDAADAGFRGWYLHLDADAVIVQPDFDIRAYLAGKADCALVIAPGGRERWNVNDGVFFLNMSHEHGREIVQRWWGSARASISDELLRESVLPWQRLPDGRDFPDDQHLLQMILMHNEYLARSTFVESGSFMNYQEGSFVRQLLRAFGTGEERLDSLRRLAASIMSDWSGNPAHRDVPQPTRACD